MTIITGHLTATNKKHIAYLFNAKLFSAKINRINYKITDLGHSTYLIESAKRETDWCETVPKMITHKAIIKY